MPAPTCVYVCFRDFLEPGLPHRTQVCGVGQWYPPSCRDEPPVWISSAQRADGSSTVIRQLPFGTPISKVMFGACPALSPLCDVVWTCVGCGDRERKKTGGC